jgi:small subunit ribosomal protein S9
MTADEETPTEGPDAGAQEQASDTPEQSAQAPEPGDQAPEPGDQAPEAGEQAPEAGEQAPEAGAQAPETGEQAPEAGAEGGQLQAPSEEPSEIAAAAEDAPPEASEQAPEASEQPQADDDGGEEQAHEPAPRVKPSVPGAHLEVDIVPEGVDPLGRGEEYADRYAVEEEEEEGEQVAPVEEAGEEQHEEILEEPIATAAIDLAAGARYRATGKRKTAIARVTLRPGAGTYLVNGRSLEEHFPRTTLQRNIRQPLETVGYQERMDVVARLHGGGISAQAGALRHGVARALLEADPNLRGELKRRGFLTRDSRAKERKKAGLKKARKRPQFSKR